MTNGEQFSTAEIEVPVERTSKLDSVLHGVIAHTDTLDAGYEKTHPDYRRDWRDYISPFVTRAYEQGVDISDDDASHYVKDYIDNPRRSSPPDYEIISEEQESPEIPANEPQGENND